MAKVGRPLWIPSAADLKKTEMLAARGLTMEQIARCLGISYDTLNERSKEYTEFSEAIKIGKAKGIGEIANALYEAGKKGNIAAQQFYLSRRADWKETTEQNLSITVKQEDALKQLE